MGFYPKPWYFADEFLSLSFASGYIGSVNKAPGKTLIEMHDNERTEPRWIDTKWWVGDLAQGDPATLVILAATGSRMGALFALVRPTSENPLAITLSEIFEEWPFPQHDTKDDRFLLAYFQNFVALRTLYHGSDASQIEQMSIEAFESTKRMAKNWYRLYRPRIRPTLHIDWC